MDVEQFSDAFLDGSRTRRTRGPNRSSSGRFRGEAGADGFGPAVAMERAREEVEPEPTRATEAAMIAATALAVVALVVVGMLNRIP